MSYYVRFAANWRGGTKLIAFYGSRTDDQWSALGKAGICPNGTDFFAAMLVTERTGDPGPTRFYTYHPAMAREPDGVTSGAVRRWERNVRTAPDFKPGPVASRRVLGEAEHARPEQCQADILARRSPAG